MPAPVKYLKGFYDDQAALDILKQLTDEAAKLLKPFIFFFHDPLLFLEGLPSLCPYDLHLPLLFLLALLGEPRLLLLLRVVLTHQLLAVPVVLIPHVRQLQIPHYKPIWLPLLLG